MFTSLPARPKPVRARDQSIRSLTAAQGTCAADVRSLASGSTRYRSLAAASAVCTRRAFFLRPEAKDELGDGGGEDEAEERHDRDGGARAHRQSSARIVRGMVRCGTRVSALPARRPSASAADSRYNASESNP